jgi:hypothetical protein
VGLSNVERRLACYYGAEARLTLTQENGVTVAELVLPAFGLDVEIVPVIAQHQAS